tara:strand:+ start:1607 stop:2590 length:984 start_codon:yes stop_codon:yes gene_type:complete
MSVYKPFTTSDVIVTPFKVNKSFTFQGSGSFIEPNVGIDRYLGKNIPYIPNLFEFGQGTGQIISQSQNLVYNSIKQLYYSNFIDGEDGSKANLPQLNTDGTITIKGGSGSYQPMYDNYLSNTLDANRFFPTGSGAEIGVISIPSNLFGENIKPGTFRFEGDTSVFTDDGEGNILQNNVKVGDIIYQHGMIILTAISSSTGATGGVYGSALYGTGLYGVRTQTGEFGDLISGSNDVTCSFQSTMTIYESQYKCTINPNEFTYTQNPSALVNKTDGVAHDFLTGSYFQPYITTIGLYNNTNELIAIGKLSQPLQSSNTTDTTILVNLDL